MTMPRDRSACRAGAGGFCATKRKIVNGVQVEVGVIVPAGREKPVDPAPVHLRCGALGRGPSACLAAVEVVSSVPTQKRTKRTRSSAEAGVAVFTAGGDPALDRVHKRMASELEALRELLKKAELISRGPARKGGAAPAAGKSKRVLPDAEPPRPEPRAKRRKVSPLLEKEQKQRKAPPRMSLDERKQLAAEERPGADAVVPKENVTSSHPRPQENGTSSQPPPEPAVRSTVPESFSGGGVGCTAPPALLPEAPQPPAQIAEPKKIQDAPRTAPKAVSIPGAIYRAKTRRQLLEMERAVVPDETIHYQDLRRLRIAEYGRPSIMRQLGLFLEADA